MLIMRKYTTLSFAKYNCSPVEQNKPPLLCKTLMAKENHRYLGASVLEPMFSENITIHNFESKAEVQFKHRLVCVMLVCVNISNS